MGGPVQLFFANNTYFHPGTVIALYTLGAAFGALACIKLGDILGRLRTIFLATLISMIGAILMASSYSFAQFIVARLALGFGTGVYTYKRNAWPETCANVHLPL